MKLNPVITVALALLVIVILTGLNPVQAAPLATEIVGYGQACDQAHTCGFKMVCTNTQAGVSVCLPLKDVGQICQSSRTCPFGTKCDYRQGYAAGVEPYGICKPKGFCGQSGDCQRGTYCDTDKNVCVPLQQFPRYYTDQCLGNHGGWAPCIKK